MSTVARDRPYFAHSHALVESTSIGRGTRVWAFAHILPKAVVGEDCNICDHVFIENKVTIGDRVTIKCGVQVWDGVTIESDVFVGPNVTFTNDPMPRSRQYLAEYPPTVLRHGCSIGANATLLPGISIGQHAMVGAGAVVTRSVPPYAVVVGNPARIIRYVEDAPSPPSAAPSQGVPMPVRVAGVELMQQPLVRDLRGDLVARETGRGLPFTPARSFLVFNVPTKEVRGEHAHRVCKQLLTCVKGSVSVLCDDGAVRQEFVLDSPGLGLYIPPMVWGVQYKYTQDAVLLVLASHGYDPSDYIRDYDAFLRERRSPSPSSSSNI